MTRVVLRPYRLDDAPEVLRWKNDPETTRWMGRRFQRTFTLDEARESLSAALADTSGRAAFFAVADRETLAYRGGVDLTDIDPVDKNAVLSLVIGRAEHRGLGYGGEAVDLILRYAFEDLGLHKVSLRVVDRNVGALRCYLRAGFREEGRLRDQWFLDGAYCDLVLMGIFAPRNP